MTNMYVTDGTADWDDYLFLNFCGRSLGAGQTCLVTVFFYADNLGQRTATLYVADNAPNSPQGVPLTGNVVKH